MRMFGDKKGCFDIVYVLESMKLSPEGREFYKQNNVSMGDQARLARRRSGCPLDRLGETALCTRSGALRN